MDAEWTKDRGPWLHYVCRECNEYVVLTPSCPHRCLAIQPPEVKR